MKTQLLRLVGYKGIDALEIRPKTVAALRGGNGKGKTTVLDAFRSLSDGGSEPDSVNKDADEAIIKLVIEVEEGDHPDYPAGRYEIERKIRRDGYGLTVKNPKGVKIQREKAFVEAFLPKIGFDPVAFDLLTDEQRSTELERFLRVPVAQTDIRKAAALVELPPMKEDIYPDGIAQIDLIDAGLEKQASDIRAEVKNLAGSIATFEKALEGSNVEDVAAELKATRKEHAEKLLALENESAAIRASVTKADTDIEAAARKDLDTITAWYMEEVESLNKLRLERVDAVRESEEKSRKAAAKKTESRVEETIRPIERRIVELESALDVLEEKATRAAKLSGERKQLAEWGALRIRRSEQLESITIARKQLENLRMRKLATCDLPDLKTIKGRLYLDGILSSEVNSARRLMKWVEVAARFSDIPGQLIVVDELERLDDANLKIFEDAIRASGLQLFGARVDPEGGPLRVDETLLTA